ncbi:LacI family DNA-binding transcriptional regulator [Rhizobium sullae]|uniref:LacI family DNA-binding transcriptional regulator n=1 Tax=Rhizobium sullae TaxID=50338 RepID=UPI001FCD566E|nr:LacI family DNA-binding transcriptional regulator [Rhizobium sullae]
MLLKENVNFEEISSNGDRAMGKPTARDLAAAAGVSLSTVDRVLNNRGGVSEDKERRVLEYARKLKIDRALNQRAARTLRIAVLLQSRANPFHAAVQDSFEAANRDFLQYNLQFQVYHIDPTRPAATVALTNALSLRCDGLVIVSPQNEDIAAALRAFGRNGKPVITLATDIRDAERYAYVGPDNRKAGRVAGDLMGRLLGKEGGEIVVISGMLSMIGHEEREMGFRAVLRERYPLCKVAEVLESMERGERAGDLVFNALIGNPRIRGIYNASAGARSVASAMNALGRRSDIVFITHELTDERRQLMREGMIDAIIDQNPVVEVRTAVEALAAYFRRKDEPPISLMTPIQVHMIENC